MRRAEGPSRGRRAKTRVGRGPFGGARSMDATRGLDLPRAAPQRRGSSERPPEGGTPAAPVERGTSRGRHPRAAGRAVPLPRGCDAKCIHCVGSLASSPVA
jgi:hypothetical protein